MLEMIDEPVRVAHDCGFPPFAEVTGRRYFSRCWRAGGHQYEIRPVSFEQRQLTLAFGRWAR
jgi:hypothetical protein